MATTVAPPPLRLVGFKHPRKIPISYCRYIGHVVTSWTYTELHMLNLAWQVFGIKDPAAGRLVSWGLNPVDKVKLFSSLSGSRRFPQWITDPSEKKELDSIAKEADRIRGERNKLVHGLWSFAPGERGQYRILYMRENEQKLLPQSIKIPLARVKQLASDLDALNERLEAFRRRRRAPIP